MIESGPGESAPAGGWRTAVVREVRHPTPRGVVLLLEVQDRVDHLPGQHYVIRLTAEDGYTATRSYSVASAPADPLLEFYVERLAGGEVSGFLAEVVVPGDRLEIRGPIGGWFVWDGHTRAVGIAGGSGVVPLVAMARHAAAIGSEPDLSIVAAARTLDDLPYQAELIAAGAQVVLSRAAFGNRSAGRLATSDLEPLFPLALRRAARGHGTPRVAGSVPNAPGIVFVCGSAPFAETASALAVSLGCDPARVRVERFGPSGA